jgi:hypothetical protein
MFCPTKKAEVQDHFDLTDDFRTDRFTSTKSYPTGSSVTFKLANIIYGFIPEAHLLDCDHSPAIKRTIMLNSKLTQISWHLVDWELWGCSASKVNTNKLIATFKCVHKGLPTWHRLHRYHKTDPGCSHCGEYEVIEHIFT